jgi:23S rRNA (guanosine2251-2'-O)-methyltransferase
MELLEQRPREVERVLVARDAAGPVGRALRLARAAGVPVSHLSRQALEQRLGRRRTSQGIAAITAPLPYADADEVCRRAAAAEPGWLVLLDGVTDQGNLGAIVRTAAAVGVTGVLLGAEGTAGLGPAVAKASAGAVERIPVAREARPARRLARLAAEGFLTVALDPRGSRPWDEAPLAGRLVLVAGGEGRGLRPSLLEACRERVAIPLTPAVESLNVGVALGVVLFEALRRRRDEGRRGRVSSC